MSEQKTTKQLIREQQEQEQLAKAQTDNYRAQVQYRELIARSNKAEFEIMDFYMKASHIEPEYRSLMAKEGEARKELDKQLREQVALQVEEQNNKPEPTDGE